MLKRSSSFKFIIFKKKKNLKEKIFQLEWKFFPFLFSHNLRFSGENFRIFLFGSLSRNVNVFQCESDENKNWDLNKYIYNSAELWSLPPRVRFNKFFRSLRIDNLTLSRHRLVYAWSNLQRRGLISSVRSEPCGTYSILFLIFPNPFFSWSNFN